eukprot:1172889-Pleurochrysis_carterae.AAC.1
MQRKGMRERCRGRESDRPTTALSDTGLTHLKLTLQSLLNQTVHSKQVAVGRRVILLLLAWCFSLPLDESG